MLKDHKESVLTLEDIVEKKLTFGKLLSLKQAPACSEHPEKVAEVCCENCDNLPICIVCGQFERHQGHILHGVKVLAENERKRAKEIQEKLQANAENLHHIPKEVEDAKRRLETNVTAKKKKLRRQYDSKVDTIKAEQTESERTLRRIEEEVSKTEQTEVDELEKKRQEEIQALNQIYDELINDVKRKNKEKREEKGATDSRYLTVLSETLGSVDKEFEDANESMSSEGKQNAEKLDTISYSLLQWIKRVDNLMCTLKSILASKDDWTDVRCLPEINAAGEPLVDEVVKGFPGEEGLSDVVINDLQTELPKKVTPPTREKPSSAPQVTPPPVKVQETQVKEERQALKEVVSVRQKNAVDIPPPANIVREPVRPVSKPVVKRAEPDKKQTESGAPEKVNNVVEKDSSSVDPVVTPVVPPKSEIREPPAAKESQVSKGPSSQASKEELAQKGPKQTVAAKAPEVAESATLPSAEGHAGVAKPPQVTPAGNPGVAKPQQAKGPAPRKEQSAAANKGPSAPAPKGQQASKGPQTGKGQQAAKVPQADKEPRVSKEPEFKVSAPALALKEAKTNNIRGSGLKAMEKASETTKRKEKAAVDGKTAVEGDNAKNKEGEPTPSDKKMVLKYTYRDDQWSPLNQGGKKQYDRSFLLQFRPDCTSKPQGLPDIPDIVLEEADIRSIDGKGVTAKGGGDCFMPTYMKSPRMKQSAPNFPKGGGRSKQSKEKTVNSRPSSSQDDQLKRSKNAWKSGTKKDDDADTELLKRFKSILNKLTPQNFSKLMAQTMALPINTEERLKGVTDLVFDTAIIEPKFSQSYANMCRVMQNIGVKNAEGVPVQFRQLIIIRCQKQFEKQRNDEQLQKERQRIAELPTEEDRAEATEEMNYQQMIAKKQIIGNICFIGELFKLRLLTERTMQGCIFLLLKAKDEESLECMSKLVSTIGHSLDHPKSKALMDQYFQQVNRIIKENKVSSRIRFMLQDLKDLRSSNWVPRRNEAKPMTIDQIRKDAEKEKQRKEQEKLVARFSRPKGPARSMEKYQSDIDGWNTTPGGRATKQNVIDNPSKLKMTRQVGFTEPPSTERPPAERPVTRHRTPKEVTRMGNFQRDLILEFQKDNVENNAVFDFIENTIPPSTRNTKEFIRSLVSVVCFGAGKGVGTHSRGDHELLKKRSILMQRYIDGNPQLELQALFAVQALNYSLENPPGLLRLYFDVLYDEDVISEETFYAWRDSTEPSEKTGKGIALKSVASFYTWLKKSDPPN